MSADPPIDRRLSAIIEAAEATAEEIRQDAERRLAERLAEADRAVDHRVQAAEAEAAEILGDAREDAARLRANGTEEARAAVAAATSEARDIVARAQSEADRIRMEADAHKEAATSEALAIISRAQENAEIVQRTAADEAARVRNDAAERSRELIKAARATAGMVQADGEEIVGDLRELGDSMRSNAARLLRDVQTIHSAMLAQIDRIDPDARSAAAAPPPRGARSSRGPARGTGGSAARTPEPLRERGGRREPGDALEIPEFIPRG